MKAAERPIGSLVVDGEPANHALYEEYVRGFDEIPVLDDAVRIPPRRSPSPSFVHGERRSLRKEERDDGYSVREATLAEIESLYGEYLAPAAARPHRKQARAKKKSSGKRRRKSSAAA
ncbi:MAG TPA: hypothetical protein VM692_08245 [Gammaproteobacteria bacterium]|nr:hypothetical protein [Gammaproteobacteria bacterium]